MADRASSKAPKKEGNNTFVDSFSSSSSSSSVNKKRSSSSAPKIKKDKKTNNASNNKPRSPIVTRSRSRNIDSPTATAAVSTAFQQPKQQSPPHLVEYNNCATTSRSSKRLKSCPVAAAGAAAAAAAAIAIPRSKNNISIPESNKKLKVSDPKFAGRSRNNKSQAKNTQLTYPVAGVAPPLNENSRSKNLKILQNLPSNTNSDTGHSGLSDNNNRKLKRSLTTESSPAAPRATAKKARSKASAQTVTGNSETATNSKTNEDTKRKKSSTTTNHIVMENQNGSNFSNNHAAASNSSGAGTGGGTSSTTSTSTNNNETGQMPSTSAILNSYALAAASPGENDEDSDMNRLQTILESKGLHPHILGLNRMPSFFYRSFNNSNSKAQQLLNALNTATNDSEKLHYILEMCQLLLLGNEDTLVGFPIKAVVPTLMNLLSMEHNFEIMHHACRALTYMMEALPRSVAVVLEAVPVFLEKLQAIQCMDVAEQSLSALEMLSRRNGKAILHARGVSACLTYLDFFSIDAQRSALAITANCFMNLTADDFQYVQDSLPILGAHLTIEDKKCIESICLAFHRLVECYQNDCAIISEIASQELLTNLQNVLMTMPPILNNGSFVNVIRMLSIMCFSCSQIAVELLKLNICETLKCLLLCSDSNVAEKGETMNLISRSPQEICELTSFIAELMPSLPLSGIFSIDLLFSKPNPPSSEVPIWQWKDERGLWQPFNGADNKIIESAYQSGEDELELSSSNRTFIVDFNTMQRICEVTGNSLSIQRKSNTFTNSELVNRSNIQTIDPRAEFIHNEPKLSSNFIKFVFKVLYEVYNNSAGYMVRYKCLNAILRIVYYSPKELLQAILKDQSISSSIATMLASHDIRIVVCAVQMCNILMEKMPEIFAIYFQREGVIHQIRKLYLDEMRFNDKSRDAGGVCNSKLISNAILYSNSSSSFIVENAQMILNRTRDSLSSIECLSPANFQSSIAPNVGSSAATKSCSNASGAKSSSTTNNEHISGRDDVMKRKRTRKSMPFSGSRNPPSSNYEQQSADGNNPNETAGDLNICNSLSTTYLNNLPVYVGEAINLNISHNKNSSRLSSSKDFLQRLNPTRWARWNQSSPAAAAAAAVAANSNSNVVIPTTSNSTGTKDLSSQKSSNTNKDKIKAWIKEQAKSFDEKYFRPKTDANEKEAPLTSKVLFDLTEAIGLLKQDPNKGLALIKSILLDSDLSSFELIHSGLVQNLLTFLVCGEDSSDEIRANHLRSFLHIFVTAPLSDMAENIEEMNFDPKPFSILVKKLNACVSQLEQLPIRVQDSSVSSRSGIRFINPLNVNLIRHPSCTNLKKYKGPMIRMDPFTPIQALEQYLLSKGFGKIKEGDEEQSDEDLSEEDFDINIGSSSHIQGKHRLQFLIGERVLPYNVSLIQGIKQCMAHELDNDGEDTGYHFVNHKFWSTAFVIHYRLSNEPPTTTGSSSSVASSRGGTRRSKSKTYVAGGKKKDELWLEGKVPRTTSPLEPYLKSSVAFSANVNDQTSEVICLLRVLYGLNRHWGHLYEFSHVYNPLIPLKEFINNKLSVKASRQLQDAMVIMTGTLPMWLSELAYACPFMFPFDIRYLLFYVVCFDRDRALQRLFENSHDLSSSLDPRERLHLPRLEKRKKTISRNDIFKSAETLFNDPCNSRSLLEIQYENEVGTGLGPTLEFYALVSKEFQRSELEMWRGDVVVPCNLKNNNNDSNKIADNISYVHSNCGLFPLPIGRHIKPSSCTKIKSRFRLLGKFMAKALIDSRMIDINLNVLFYKWLLSEETTLTVSDLYHLDYTFFSSISQMYKIALRKSKMNISNTSELLKLQGSCIENLNLDFIMPGYANIELRKGGKDMPVTLNNLENYIELVSHWALMEGIVKQMEAFKEGFNSVFDLTHLKLFYPEELHQLFGGSSYKSWDTKMLQESCKTDHGFTHDSKAIKFLFEILSSYNDEEQRKFLQFLTGFPRLPIGGFKSLIPPFTIVKKSATESDNPNCLPSVMTCVNYLKLPDYPTIEMMREKLKIAINEGQFSFHLS